MNVLTTEWLSRTERDFDTAHVVMAPTRDEPFPDIACFHCQQCAEKYLKAFLTEHRIRFARSHNLIDQLELCKKLDPEFKAIEGDLRELEGYAVRARYPGIEVTYDMGAAALPAASLVRDFIRGKPETD